MNTENNNYELFVNEEDKGWAYLPTAGIVVMYMCPSIKIYKVEGIEQNRTFISN